MESLVTCPVCLKSIAFDILHKHWAHSRNHTTPEAPRPPPWVRPERMGIHPDQRPRISTHEDEHLQGPTVPTEPWEEDEIEDIDMVVPDEEFENAGIELNNVG